MTKPQHSRRSGFALVIALSLMAFILLLLLSMSTLVQVETRTAEITRDTLKARQNALLATYIALGNLQKTAGPDQRTTATGDILASTDVKKAKFTGVWDVTTGEPIDWLVSRDPKVAFDPASFNNTATNAATDVELVSARRVGTPEVAEAVLATPVDILDTNGNPTGQFAWWVGDEGVKASVDLVESEEYISTAVERARVSVVPRFGIEALSALGSFFVDDSTYANSDFRGEMSLWGGLESMPISLPNSETALSDHFHDLSSGTLGVLSNNRDGGLREDLGFYFQQGLVPPDPLVDLAGSPFERITWEQIGDFYNLFGSVTSGTVAIRPQTASSHGIFPLVRSLQWLYGVSLENNYTGVAQTSASRTYTYYLHATPFLVLANPYNVPISATNFKVVSEIDSTARFEVFTKSNTDGQGGTEVPIIEEALEDVLGEIELVIPSLTIPAGEAVIYSLDYSQAGFVLSDPSNDHFRIDFTPGNTQEIILAEGWDDGLASVRVNGAYSIAGTSVENTAWTPGTGEDESDRPLRRMYFRVAEPGGDTANVIDYSLQTYIKDASGDWDFVQTIGPISFEGQIVEDSSWSRYWGFWAVSNLPDSMPDSNLSVGSFTRNNYVNAPASAATATNNGAYLGCHMLMLGESYQNDVNNRYQARQSILQDLALRSPVLRAWGDDQTMPLYRSRSSSLWSWYDWLLWNNMNDSDADAVDDRFAWLAGRSRQNGNPSNPAAKVFKAALFDLPRAYNGNSDIVSIAHFQHFNASGYVDPDAGDSFEDYAVLYSGPSLAIGNSYASPYVLRDELSTGTIDGVIDLSYRLNERLFDGFFLSSIPFSGAVDDSLLLNQRIKRYPRGIDDADLRADAQSAASHSLISGAFNVNSTSVDAWYALLHGLNDFTFSDKSGAEADGVFPRTRTPLEGSFEAGDGVTNADEMWAGWRHFVGASASDPDDDLIRDLAEAIVEEVRLRGPFLTLGDFVNRELVDPAGSDARLGLSGALQAALDRVVNVDTHPDYHLEESNFTSNLGSLASQEVVDWNHIGSGPVDVDLDGADDLPRSALVATPGWVMQADLLQSLGPVIASRSDTFRIRSLGRASEAISGKVLAEVVVEAIVQRVPQFIDDIQSADTLTGDLNATNQSFGRRFEIRSIRVMDQSEI